MEIADTYKYRSIDVARYVIAYANENKYGINLTKKYGNAKGARAALSVTK